MRKPIYRCEVYGQIRICENMNHEGNETKSNEVCIKNQFEKSFLGLKICKSKFRKQVQSQGRIGMAFINWIWCLRLRCQNSDNERSPNQYLNICSSLCIDSISTLKLELCEFLTKTDEDASILKWKLTSHLTVKINAAIPHCEKEPVSPSFWYQDLK